MVIEGFKSYKEQTVTEPFSPKVNTVGASPPPPPTALPPLTRRAAVGANGAGKTNFFHGALPRVAAAPRHAAWLIA